MGDKPAVRLGDIGSGHDCYPPRPVIQGSKGVFIDDRPAVRIGDRWAVHCCPGKDCHDGISIQGSKGVFIDDRPAVRVGDAIDCGSFAAHGSDGIFIM